MKRRHRIITTIEILPLVFLLSGCLGETTDNSLVAQDNSSTHTEISNEGQFDPVEDLFLSSIDIKRKTEPNENTSEYNNTSDKETPKLFNEKEIDLREYDNKIYTSQSVFNIQLMYKAEPSFLVLVKTANGGDQLLWGKKYLSTVSIQDDLVTILFTEYLEQPDK